MSVKYNGKSPSKLWYIWQNTKGFAHSITNPATKKDAKAGAKSGGISAAVLLGGGAITKIGFIAIMPIIPTVISLAAVGGAGYFGLNAYRKFKLIKKSSTHQTYMRKQEQKWLDRKNRAPLFTRIKEGIGKKIDSIPRPLLKIAKWGGIGTALAGVAASGAAALNALGVGAFSTGATATAVLGGIVKAGAIVGLTATAAPAVAVAIAVAAIPVGIAAAVTASKIAYRTDPERLSFGKKKKWAIDEQEDAPKKQLSSTAEPAPAPAQQQSGAFNDNAAPKKEEPAEEDTALSEARKKAAAERRAARKKAAAEGGKRFG
ncbi:MAG: hypothetical protein GC185_04515 [Alphaproteobacteria bacterium]|nr:hypothetical protein [Alphaproteobacteria bacterium]